VADAKIFGFEGRGFRDDPYRSSRGQWASEPAGSSSGGFCEDVADAEVSRLEGWVFGGRIRSDLTGSGQDSWPVGEHWRVEPDVGRVAHGVPARVDRLRGLGNSIVPQIAQWIAERIKDAESRGQ
jgi:hypothetical protein